MAPVALAAVDAALEPAAADALAMRESFSSPSGWNGMLEHYAQVAARIGATRG